MSLLSSFIRNQLLKAVEEEFQAHTPEMKAMVINEMQAFAAECTDWVAKKLDNQDQPQ